MKRYLLPGFVVAAVIYIAVAFYGRAVFNARCEASNGVSVQGYGRLICLTDQPVIAEQ
jgi:hypothetical protein